MEHNFFNIFGYKIGAAYCRKSLLKGGVCTFVHKKCNYSNVDLSKYCKEQDTEACAIKLELIALNICVVTVYRASCDNFNSFLNELDSIIKSLYKVILKLIICGDINIDHLTDNKRKKIARCCVTVL
jgi:exonuclease III